MALSLDGTTGISATGNIWGNNIIVPGSLTVGTFSPAVLSTSGNITGNYILGNGSQLTGIDATSIQSGTSNVRVISSGGNVTTGIGGTPDVVVVSTTGQYVTGISSTSGNVIGGNLQTAGNVNSANVIATNLTGTLTTAAQTNITLLGTLSSLSVTGNVQGGNLRTVGLISAAGNVQAGNVIAGSNVSAANIDTSGQISAAGNITGLNINSSNADLAEKYVADAAYEPGTVLKFGGEQEVTMATEFDDTRVAGVVSTNPGYLMNITQSGVHVVDIALQGRVPCKVRGPVYKGDLMVSAGSGHACANNLARAGTILGKSLQDFTGEFGTIEIAVGRD